MGSTSGASVAMEMVDKVDRNMLGKMTVVARRVQDGGRLGDRSEATTG